jgi:hypothetical protein
VFKKRSKQGLLSLKTTAMPSCNTCKRVEFAGSEVRHRVHFEVPPTIFERIEFRSVGRQEKGDEKGVLLHECSDLSGTMGCQAIPDQDHRTSYLSQELAEKIQNECSSNVSIGMEAEIQGEAPPFRIDAQSTNDRDLSIGTGTLSEDGSTTGGRPASAEQGRHEQPALIEKYQVSF